MKTMTFFFLSAMLAGTLAAVVHQGYILGYTPSWIGKPQTNQPMPAENLDAKPSDGMKPLKLQSAGETNSTIVVKLKDGAEIVATHVGTNWVEVSRSGDTEPTPQEWIQLGIATAWRNPDIKDMRALMPAAIALWNASHQPKKP